MAKFKIGDEVKIINYGSLIWVNKDADFRPNLPLISVDDRFLWYDIAHDLVGKIGVIHDILQGEYSLDFAAWFSENQLELVND